MKKNYIDFNICFDCEHCKKEGNTIKCDFNNILLASSINYFKQEFYTNVDSSSLKKVIPKFVQEKFDSLIENIDERCPRKLEHLIRYSNKKISVIKK